MTQTMTVTFDDPGAIPGLDEAALNALDFGVIRVDDAGEIQFYNRYESELAGVDPEDAEGKNFFTQVAPCTNNRLFFGRFKDGVENGSMDASFPYTFTYKLRPMLVDIRLHRGPDGSNWILVRKK